MGKITNLFLSAVLLLTSSSALATSQKPEAFEGGPTTLEIDFPKIMNEKSIGMKNRYTVVVEGKKRHVLSVHVVDAKTIELTVKEKLPMCGESDFTVRLWRLFPVHGRPVSGNLSVTPYCI